MLKNYIIEEELGKGTYGVVFKAKKRSDNNIYVIKQISLKGLTNSQKSEVKLESEILRKIKSKYVVQYYDSFEENNNLNIVMEYCESGDLNGFIEKQKKSKYLLHEADVWKFFIKITLGLADIHKLKILHRDLKSLNIFLKQGNDVRVGDLGVAKILNQTFFAKTFIGTPYYLSPEICEDKPYNDKSDVWALGCILYELCTYQHPFTARSQGGLILKILNDNPKPIDNYYSKELRDLISIIFNKDYHKRPSCEQILGMTCVIEKAKKFGIFEDIKNSFPDIESRTSNDKIKLDKLNNKINLIHVKPVIISNKNNNNKKRPASNYGIFNKGGVKNNIKFNNIRVSEKKKNQNLGFLNVPNKDKKPFLPKKIKIISTKEKIPSKGNSNKNKVRKKAIVSPKKMVFKEAEKFEKKFKEMQIKNNNQDNEQKPILAINKDNNNMNNNNWINTKDLNNICNEQLTTKYQPTIDNSKTNNSKNIKDTNNDDPEKGTMKTKLNYSIDSKVGNDKKNVNNESINNILDKTKEKNNNNDNNNCSIESDIYMTAKKDIYQPQSVKKDEKMEQNLEKKEEKLNSFGIEGSLPLMQTSEFNALLSDFSTKKDASINEFKIIDNNENKKNDFTIINNNNEEMKENIEKGKNIDNNKKISSDEEEKDEKKCLSDNAKSNEESGNDDSEEIVKEIDENNDNDLENAKETENVEEDKKSLKKELEVLEGKINYLKEEIPKLIGEEKYKYIIDICSVGIKDDSKQEEINDKIENFIKENSSNLSVEKLYNILSLFILECQYYKKKEMLDKL